MVKEIDYVGKAGPISLTLVSCMLTASIRRTSVHCGSGPVADGDCVDHNLSFRQRARRCSLGGGIFLLDLLCLLGEVCPPQTSLDPNVRLHLVPRPRFHGSGHRPGCGEHVLLFQQHSVADNDQHILHRRGCELAIWYRTVFATRLCNPYWRRCASNLRSEDPTLALAVDWVGVFHGPFRLPACPSHSTQQRADDCLRFPLTNGIRLGHLPRHRR